MHAASLFKEAIKLNVTQSGKFYACPIDKQAFEFIECNLLSKFVIIGLHKNSLTKLQSVHICNLIHILEEETLTEGVKQEPGVA